MSQSTNKTKVLITGVSGLLGSNLSWAWRHRYDLLGLYHSHPWSLDGMATRKVDLTSSEDVRQVVADFRPDMVVHTAAIADVDRCEVNPALAQQTNVLATQILVDAALKVKKFVYISTDLVYDGVKGKYIESDPIGLINTYSQTKFAGENHAIRHPRALIARTNFFGWNVQNKLSLAEWGLHELAHSRGIKGFTDAVFSSIYTMDLSQLLAEAMDRDLTGVYHCVSHGAMSKFDFLRQLARRTGLDEGLIIPSSITQFPFKAKRAKNLSLQTEKLSRDLNHSMVEMEQSLEHFIRDYYSGLIAHLNPCNEQRERFVRNQNG